MRRPVPPPAAAVDRRCGLEPEVPATGSERRHGAARLMRARQAAIVSVAAGVLVVTSACTAPAPVVTTAPSSAAPSATATPSVTPAPVPTLVPEGTATENLPFFRSIVQQVWASGDNLRGAVYVDALTAAGFDRAAMQRTADTSTIGEPAESIQFSVAWRDGCLIGQVGPATGEPVTTVLPLLAGARCLVGETVPIDG